MSTARELPRRRGRPRLKTKTIAQLEATFVTRDAVAKRQVEQSSYMLDDEEPSDRKHDIDDDDGYDSEDQPKPVGSSIGSADKPPGQLYASFQWVGQTYELEDAVMLSPDKTIESPPVGIIKGIRQAFDGEMFATLRWLYRPDAHIKDDPRWLAYDPRELLFTDHIEEVPVVRIMYKCVVHFLYSHKQLPKRRVHPGFVVQHFYDHLKQKVLKIGQDSLCKGIWKEICSHVRETELRIGEVPNIDNGDQAPCPKGLKFNEPVLGQNTSMFNNEEDKLSPDKHGLDRSDEQLNTQQLMRKTPESHVKPSFNEILSLYGALRNDARRDIFLERLLEAIYSQWDTISRWEDGDGFLSKYMEVRLKWPDCVIGPIFSLENEVDEKHGGDPQKYNQKMRQLVFNLKTNGVLAKRFVTQELNPSILLKMTPDELKAGLTVKELPKTDSDDKQEIQMVDVLCRRCSEKKVCLLNVIQAGVKQRYQLQCDKCGNSWTTSVNEIS